MNYNKIAYGQYGTGLVPPTREEWSSMRKLKAVQSGTLRATHVDQQIDHSQTQYFSPTHHETARSDTQHPGTGSPLFSGDFSMILIAQFT